MISEGAEDEGYWSALPFGLANPPLWPPFPDETLFGSTTGRSPSRSLRQLRQVSPSGRLDSHRTVPTRGIDGRPDILLLEPPRTLGDHGPLARLAVAVDKRPQVVSLTDNPTSAADPRKRFRRWLTSATPSMVSR